ncbi:MAG: hypothetical protein HeimC3_17000 [Candidatus Heimdallarchaeota archaeon LC_3]|nr:MAG: hypothetical protein HeimC3_17000 [Candidatus Heimdallarchaeota archaeon LC_3]
MDGGSGVNQLTFIILDCILAKPGMVITIDEPEVHLHAKYQALLLDLLIETVNKGCSNYCCHISRKSRLQ